MNQKIADMIHYIFDEAGIKFSELDIVWQDKHYYQADFRIKCTDAENADEQIIQLHDSGKLVVESNCDHSDYDVEEGDIGYSVEFSVYD